jgi:phenylalanyl-tRNA synthetase beta subunit
MLIIERVHKRLQISDEHATVRVAGSQEEAAAEALERVATDPQRREMTIEVTEDGKQITR